MCVRPTWLLNRNFSLKEAELRPARVATLKQGEKRKQWNGLPPLFYLYNEHTDFKAYINGLPDTCGERVKPAAPGVGEEEDHADDDESGAEAEAPEAPEADQPRSNKKARTKAAATPDSKTATGTPSKRSPRPAISMASVKQQMRKLTSKSVT